MDYEKAYKDALERAKLSRQQLLDVGEEVTEIEYIFPELKEEDSESYRIRKNTINIIRNVMNGSVIPLPISIYKESIAWLEKQGEHKSVWNEDDEAILKAIIQDIQERHPDAMWNINTSKTAAVSTKFIIKFLKSLSPQLHWKPSEEQIMAFEHFVRSIGESGYASPYDNNTKLIYSLLNDLKNF